MRTTILFKTLAAILALAVPSVLVHAQTDLATEPIVAEGRFGVAPNIMFVLDDSESMMWSYLPDWAGGKSNSNKNITIAIDAWLNANSKFNGVYYNPATEYKPPVYFNSAGDLDTTKYLSQNRANTAGWAAVQNNPYTDGSGTYNLNGEAYYYTTTAGEYCTNLSKRTCNRQNVAGGGYTEPAPLRWCNSKENATKAVPDANVCQAVEIDNNGSQDVFGYPRSPAPLASVISFTGNTTIYSIKIGGQEILPVATATNPSGTLAETLNKCFFYETGACTTAGYLAVAKTVNEIYIYAPDPVEATGVTPDVIADDLSKVSVTVFATPPDNQVPGSVKLTRIISGKTYPVLEGGDRKDCAAGTYCTFDEEMTNFANWWAYYRTRMQAMKTAASHSFETVSEKYRVGFISMNNQNATSSMGKSFLNIDNFHAAHKKEWYDRLFGTTEKGETPLRQVLSQVGQIYAGKINGNLLPQSFGSGSSRQTINDPVQFSCQKNVTILSTDGYWNEPHLPGVKLDGITSVGDQDGPDIVPAVLRPQLDAGVPKYGKITEQILMDKTPTVATQKQLKEEKTQSLRALLMKLEKTKPQQKTSILQEKISNLQEGIYPLQSQTSSLRQRTAILRKRIFKYWALGTDGDQWQQRQLQRYKRTYTDDSWTQQRATLQRRTATLKKQVSKLQTRTAELKTQSAPLLMQTSQQQAKTTQVQQKTSANGIVWSEWSNVNECSPSFNSVDCRELPTTDWQDVSSCVPVDKESPQLVNPGMDSERTVYTTNRECRTISDSWTETSTCTPSTDNGRTVNCKYGSYTTLLPVSGGTCTAISQSTGSGTWTGPAVNCIYEWSGYTETNSCTPVAQSTGPTYSQLNPVECKYSAWVTEGGATTCENKAQSSTFDVEKAVSCTYSAWSAWSGVSSCSPVEMSSGTGEWNVATATECRYVAVTPDLEDQSSCTVTANPETYPSQIIVTGCTKVDGTWSAWVKAKECVANDTTECNEELTSDWQNVGSCTPSTSTTGLITECRRIRSTDHCLRPGDAGYDTAASEDKCIEEWDDWKEVTTCTPIKQGIGNTVNDVECKYDSWSSNINVSACTATPQGSGSTTWKGPAVECSYTGWSSWVNDSSCIVKRQTENSENSTDGFVFEPNPKQCRYATAATWTKATSPGCTSTNPSIGGEGVSNVSEKVGCRYDTSADWTDATSDCTPVAKSTGSPYTELEAKECKYTDSEWEPVDACTEVAKSVSPPYEVLKGVECSETWGDWEVATSCTANAAGGSGPEVQCKYQSVSEASWVDTTTEGCVVTSPLPTGPNYVEEYVNLNCKTILERDWYATSPPDIDYQCPSSSYITGGTKYSCRYVFEDGALTPNTVTTILQPGDTCTPTDNDGTPAENIIKCRVTRSAVELVDSCACFSAPGGGSLDVCTEIAPTAPDFMTTSCYRKDPVSGRDYASGPTPDTLADVAQYYYMTDLRTTDLGNCSGPGGEDLCFNDNEISPSWQHMVTYTLGLGASGYMQYDPNYDSGMSEDFNAIKNGTSADPATGLCSWQEFGACNWPQPVTNTQTNIDDLWHAAVNGRGTYYSASDYVSLAAGIKSALEDIQEGESSSSAAVLGSRIISEDNNLIYRGSFTTVTWAGQLEARELDTNTGEVVYEYCRKKDVTPEVRVQCPATDDVTIEKVEAAPVWEAQSPLDNRSYDSRKIYTFDDSGSGDKLKLFNWSNLTTNEQGFFKLAHLTSRLTQICTTGSACLSDAQKNDWVDETNPPSATDAPAVGGINLVNFLRGERKYEDSGTGNKLYRSRAHVLGDIVNAEPVYVQGTKFEFVDKGYSNFRQAQKNRKAMIYAAANDGMLHAFHATKDSTALPKAGTEEWAYIPSMIMQDLYKLADRKYSDLHEFFVDATPTVGDACFDNCPIGSSGTADWRTVLVGGLGGGGKGYYALDVTDPVNPKALWEFTDSRLGYTYGNPKITKLLDGTWVALLTSGYNNADGIGYLFIVDIKSGDLIRVLSTETGSTSSPSGLARIAAWADFPMYDNTTLRVYAGDLLGNVWRFNVNEGVNDGGAGSHFHGQLLATLTDRHGTAQPVTAKPEIGMFNNKVMVYIGTGQLLGETDMQTRTQQTMYGIIDPVIDAIDDKTPIYSNIHDSGSGFIEQTLSDGGICTAEQAATYICSEGDAVIKGTRNQLSAESNGWYVDFMVGGERANTDPALSNGILMFNTNVPRDASGCQSKAYSNTYSLDAINGGALLENGIVGSFISDSLAGRVEPAWVGDKLITLTTPGGGPIQKDDQPPKEIFRDPRRVSWTPLLTDQ